MPKNRAGRKQSNANLAAANNAAANNAAADDATSGAPPVEKPVVTKRRSSSALNAAAAQAPQNAQPSTFQNVNGTGPFAQQPVNNKGGPPPGAAVGIDRPPSRSGRKNSRANKIPGQSQPPPPNQQRPAGAVVKPPTRIQVVPVTLPYNDEEDGHEGAEFVSGMRPITRPLDQARSHVTSTQDTIWDKYGTQERTTTDRFKATMDHELFNEEQDQRRAGIIRRRNQALAKEREVQQRVGAALNGRQSSQNGTGPPPPPGWTPATRTSKL